MTDQDRHQEEVDRLRRLNEAQLKRQDSPQLVPKPSWADKVDQPVERLTDKQLNAIAAKILHERAQRQKEAETRKADVKKDQGVFHRDNAQATSDDFNCADHRTAEDIISRFLKPQEDRERSR